MERVGEGESKPDNDTQCSPTTESTVYYFIMGLGFRGEEIWNPIQTDQT